MGKGLDGKLLKRLHTAFKNQTYQEGGDPAKIFARFDEDGSGELTEDEFTAFLNGRMAGGGLQMELDEATSHLLYVELGGNDTVSVEECKTFLTEGVNFRGASARPAGRMAIGELSGGDLGTLFKMFGKTMHDTSGAYEEYGDLISKIDGASKVLEEADLSTEVYDMIDQCGATNNRDRGCLFLLLAALRLATLDEQHVVADEQLTYMKDVAEVGVEMAGIRKVRKNPDNPDAKRVSATHKAMAEKMEKIRFKFLGASYVQGGVDYALMFSRADKDGSGEIDLGELKGIVRRVLKLPPHDITDQDINQFFKALDADSSGMLEIAEITDFLETGEVPDKKQFVIGATAGLKLSKIQKDMLAGAVLEKVRHRMLASTYQTSNTVDDWNEIFSWSDKKSPGHLDLLELRAVCRGTLKIDVEDVTDTEIATVFRTLDIDGSGTIDLDELKAFMANPKPRYILDKRRELLMEAQGKDSKYAKKQNEIRRAGNGMQKSESRNEILYFQGLAKLEAMEESRHAVPPNCTFKPKINDDPGGNYVSTWQGLYADAEMRHKKKKAMYDDPNEYFNTPALKNCTAGLSLFRNESLNSTVSSEPVVTRLVKASEKKQVHLEELRLTDDSRFETDCPFVPNLTKTKRMNKSYSALSLKKGTAPPRSFPKLKPSPSGKNLVRDTSEWKNTPPTIPPRGNAQSLRLKRVASVKRYAGVDTDETSSNWREYTRPGVHNAGYAESVGKQQAVEIQTNMSAKSLSGAGDAGYQGNKGQ